MPLSSQVEEYKRVIGPIVALLREPNRATNIAEALSLRYSSYLRSGESLPDIGFLLELLARELEGSQQNIEGADLAYTLEESDDPAVKKAVEDATTAVYDELVQLRDEAVAIYGEGAINALGMQGETTRVPVRLELHARAVVNRLKNEKTSLGKSKSTRLVFDRKAAADTLLALVEALTVQLQALTREKAELQQKQDERNGALTHWEKRVPSNCAATRGLLLIAGDEEGAGRVASTPKRRTSNASTEDTTEPPSNPEPGV